MQIPSVLSPSINTANAPAPRQQLVELAQAPSSDPNQSVLADSAQAVAAAGQSQQQQSSADAQKQQTDPKQLQDSVNQLNTAASLYNSSLQFSVDKDTGATVVKVVDKANNQVIRQIPSEEALRIAKAIGDFKGLLLKDKA
ncbi:flagellar protein FlaG [Chromobacterium subtsugae]|uniref:Flagellar protein FlaG n=1 Tax=Chromobacterium subtsugae TaxID=251747 RepID=A0ABS7FJC4_9NEIS|nr:MULTISPECIES: flagellar protein FlaG [Chromobacterium]KUM04979.1 flagellar biosynthesis protein FlaG [Chromobacterium subtsugae]KZE85230.1 flagellar biosynthesis protein FlaG [Chromobacterium sp. F49]MBW7568410.1 flagellar protein FlaG [Chromobacterium subtsugae]MBW8289585.1 flagellar protein FlaG [Chromobacterium subtsugae]OBU84941.1 flagellar protein FlaG [Chromobacterium subtsugae]